MTKSKYYNQFTAKEISVGYSFMQNELLSANASVKLLDIFHLAWQDFYNNKFSYDGATFVKERSEFTLFEVPAFIHDWRNSNGYVGRKIDKEMLNIMSFLCYEAGFFESRIKWMMFTFINKLRHKYILKDLQKQLPKNIYINLKK